MGSEQSTEKKAKQQQEQADAARREKQAEEDERKRKKEAEEAPLPTPWRTNKYNKWTDEEVRAMRKEITEYQFPATSEELNHFNILLLGTPNSGKTSLRNTVASVFSEDIKTLAATGTESLSSITKRLQNFQLRNEFASDGDQKLKMKFWDTMGLDDGLPTENIFKIIDGQVKNKTLLEGNLEGGLRNESEVEIKHKMHCILFVVNPTKLATFDPKEKTMTKITEIMAGAQKRGIPYKLVLTHADKMCPHVDEDLRLVFKSPRIKTLIDTAAGITTVSALNIHPIRNYSKEGDKVMAIDFLTLNLVRKIFEVCKEYCQKLEDDKEDY